MLSNVLTKFSIALVSLFFFSIISFKVSKSEGQLTDNSDSCLPIASWAFPIPNWAINWSIWGINDCFTLDINWFPSLIEANPPGSVTVFNWEIWSIDLLSNNNASNSAVLVDDWTDSRGIIPKLLLILLSKLKGLIFFCV